MLEGVTYWGMAVLGWEARAVATEGGAGLLGYAKLVDRAEAGTGKP